MTIVSNTGPLIALAKVDRLELLQQLFSQIEIPPAVQRELFAGKTPEMLRIEQASFIQVVSPASIPTAVETLTAQLGAGEQHAIALAFEKNLTLLIDDRAGRIAARRLKIAVTGLVGVLLEAKESGAITNVVPVLLNIREHGYWVSDELVKETARRAKES